MSSNVIYRKLLSFLAMFVPVQILFSVSAYAQPAITPVAGGGGCNDGTLGGVICNFIEGTQDSQGIFPALCYLFGLFVGVWAIFKLIEHVQNPHQVSVWEPIKRAIAAGAFFALPIVTEATYETLTAGDDTGLNVGGFAGTPTGGGLDAMVVGLMNDTFFPMSGLIGMFCMFAGLVLVVVGISRLLKSAQEGPRGPGGFGTIMTFIVAGAFFSADQMMAAASNTFFGTEDVAVTAALTFNAGLEAAEEEHVLSVISAVLAFVMVLGWISFVRGWFIIRDVAEGNQQASMMAAVTHILGGALAINLGPVLNAVQTTFGLDAIGVTFS